MKLAVRLALVLGMMCGVAACSKTPVAKQPSALPPSLIEGFGVGPNEAEASKLAWDDVMTRAKQLGYAQFSVKAVSHAHGYNGQPSDPNGHQVRVQIEVYPQLTHACPQLPRAADDQAGDNLARHGR